MSKKHTQNLIRAIAAVACLMFGVTGCIGGGLPGSWEGAALSPEAIAEAELAGVSVSALRKNTPASERVCSVMRRLCNRDWNREEVGRFFCGRYSQRCDVRIGVVGDSTSDEYQGFTNMPGLQWTEQLADGIDLGAYEESADARGAPRYTGFANNWALWGQAVGDVQWDSSFPPYSAMVDGLSGQIANGEIDVAFLWIGHNDILIRLFALGLPLSGPEGDEFAQALADDVLSSAVAVQNAGDVKVVLGLLIFEGDPNWEFIGEIGANVNNRLRAGADELGIDYFNPYGVVYSEYADFPSLTLNVGGETIAMQGAALDDLTPAGTADATGPCAFDPDTGEELCATPAYARATLHFDWTHANTVFAGLIGNAFIQQANDVFGFEMDLVSVEQILANAGL